MTGDSLIHCVVQRAVISTTNKNSNKGNNNNNSNINIFGVVLVVTATTTTTTRIAATVAAGPFSAVSDNAIVVGVPVFVVVNVVSLVLVAIVDAIGSDR